ncbi:MAG: hypothetical protein E2590_13045 [Chryseobacterium sp.]|uniref:hypothetical protein n=1 Tax=Epilithonimonas caeni TaxID=365343 RepID=UPI000424A7A8|nr:hypothetical protein [Epilithonimonas caeni]MPS74054.1 hypothetical protein [Chryseobacterium sp.]
MKKLFPFVIAAIFSFLLISCDRTEYVDNSTPADYPAVYDLTNVNFSYDSNSGLGTISREFANAMYDSDIVLIYRRVGTSSNAPVWQPLPQTIYNIEVGTETNHELDYTFDFTKYDFAIYASGTFNLTLRPEFINNQTFRVVLVPAVMGKNANAGDLSKMSYEEVIKKYNIDDSKIGTL